MEKFWMCFVQGRNSPTKKHTTENEARIEAARLAVSTGARVYLLEATEVASVLEVKWQKLLPPTEVTVAAEVIT